MLSDAQKQYAAQDVLYLHELKTRLDQMLEREGRAVLARACFDFVPTRAALDLQAGLREVSSPTEIRPDNTEQLLLAAARRARLAPFLMPPPWPSVLA